MASRRTIRTSSRISSFIITSPIFSRSVSSAGWSLSCLQFYPAPKVRRSRSNPLSALHSLSRGGKHCSNSLFPSRPEGPACTECCLMFASPSGAEGELKNTSKVFTVQPTKSMWTIDSKRTAAGPAAPRVTSLMFRCFRVFGFNKSLKNEPPCFWVT